MMEVLAWFTANKVLIVTAVLAILGAFSAVAKLTPTEADNKIVDALYKFVHLLGLTRK